MSNWGQSVLTCRVGRATRSRCTIRTIVACTSSTAWKRKPRMERVALLEKWQLVAPALSDKELSPVLNRLWFQGDTVMAFNDQIAIETKLKTDFKGAVPGRVLIDMLVASPNAKQVEFKLSDDDLLVKAGNTKLNLKVL